MALLSQASRSGSEAAPDSGRNGRAGSLTVPGAVSCLAAGCLAACWSDEPPPVAETYFARHDAALYADLEPDTAPQLLDFDVRMTILQEHRSFVNVLTENGLAGWAPREHLMDSATRRQIRKLTDQSAGLAGQGDGRAWDTLNVHSEPYRWAPTLYQLAKDEPFEVLDRTLVDRLPAAVASNPDLSLTAITPYSDYWFLVRLPKIGQCGWLLGNMIYAHVPIEVAMLAGGQPIVAHFRLGRRRAGADDEPAIAWLLAQSSRGQQEYDFDVLRVFRRNAKQARYSVVRRVSGLRGYLPIKTLDRVEARGRVGRGFRILAERDGQLRELTYLYGGSRVSLAHDRPSDEPVPGGLGERYRFRAARAGGQPIAGGSP